LFLVGRVGGVRRGHAVAHNHGVERLTSCRSSDCACVDSRTTGNKCSANSLQVVVRASKAPGRVAVYPLVVATLVARSLKRRLAPTILESQATTRQPSHRNLPREREGNKYYLIDVGSKYSAVKSGVCRQTAVHMHHDCLVIPS
jgi:hypothetical protein